MEIKCSVLYNDLLFDVAGNGVKWCCRQDRSGSLSSYDPSGYFKHPLLSDIRQSLKNGIQHPACHECWEVEKKGVNSWRRVYGNSSHVQTSPDLVDRQVTRLEIKFDRTCDLACIYCGPWNSTSWEKEDAKTGFFNHPRSQEDPDGMRKIKDTLLEIGRYNRKLMIEFTGGEPFLSKHFTQENLCDLIESYQTFNTCDASLILKCTSNANTPTKTLSRVHTYLENIKKHYQHVDIHMALSFESTGRYTEISRYLSDWNTVDSNVRFWLSHDWITPMISSSFNALTLPDLKNFMVYLSDVFPSNNRSIMISANVVHSPAGLNPTVLPKTFEKHIDEALVQIDSMRDMFKERSEQGYQNLRKSVLNMKETMGSTVHNKPALKGITDYCINKRKIDLKSVNPDLYGYVYES